MDKKLETKTWIERVFRNRFKVKKRLNTIVVRETREGNNGGLL